MTQPPETPEAPASPQHQSGAALVDLSVLDVDLRDRIAAVAVEEQAGEERFLPSHRILVESAIWLIAGVAIWMLTILVWR